MAEDDERWWQDGTVVKSHDQLVSLELPHLVGNGLNFKEGIAAEKIRPVRTNCNRTVDAPCKIIE